jgi:hypothetical protein
MSNIHGSSAVDVFYLFQQTPVGCFFSNVYEDFILTTPIIDASSRLTPMTTPAKRVDRHYRQCAKHRPSFAFSLYMTNFKSNI